MCLSTTALIRRAFPQTKSYMSRHSKHISIRLQNLMDFWQMGGFLTGENFTEADLRLIQTLYRHDPVYYLRMKLNGAKILHYPHLWRWLCRVYALPSVASSSSLIHCRQGYFGWS